MEQPVLVHTKVVKILGKVCDVIALRVPEGRENVWIDAAQLWAASFRADADKEPGVVSVVVPRQYAEIPVDAQAAIQAIVHQRTINLGRSALR